MVDPTFHITTPRLHLSYLDPACDAHMAYIVQLANSPEMLAMRAQSSSVLAPQPLTIPEARLAQSASSSRQEKTGYGRFAISLRRADADADADTFADQPREDKTYIGTVSMQLARFADARSPQIPDMGFALLSAYQGRGYASEACEALMQYFEQTRGAVRGFAGFTHPENRASQRLFRRLGFVDRGAMYVDGVLGCDGVGAWVAVWTKGVSEDAELASLGIGVGLGGESKVESVE